MDNSIEGLLKLKQDMETEHSCFRSSWDDIVKFVRHDADDVHATVSAKGQDKTINQFDDTAAWAHNLLASFMLGALFSPNERWVALGVEGHTRDTLDKNVLAWIENTENALFNNYANPKSNFYPTMHETLLDDTSIGTSVAYHDFNKYLDCIHYKSVSVFKTRIAESYAGFVDIVNQEKRMSYRQVAQEYSEDELYMGMNQEQARKFRDKLESSPMEELVIQVFIYPAKEAAIKRRGFEFASDHILEDYKVRIRKSGFKTFPYNVSRWSKLSNETYGRGPAWQCIRNVKVLQKMNKSILRFAAHQVDPTMILSHDGILSALNFNPGGRLFVEPEARIEQLQRQGNTGITVEMMRDKRDFISKAFFVDWIIQGQTNVEKTRHEIMDKRNEQFFLLAATIGRLSSEKAGRMIQRDIQLLIDNNKIDDFPQVEDPRTGRPFVIRPMYMSEASRAQQYLKAASAGRWVESILQLANVDPKLKFYINLENFAKRSADYYNVPEDVINSKQQAEQEYQQEVQAANQARQEEMQLKREEIAAKNLQPQQQQ